jgi:hypothetical protein
MAHRIALDRLGSFFGRCRRKQPRYSVLLSAKLVTADASALVTIRDLSSHGAQVQGSQLPPLNGVVILKRGKLEAAARVAWRNGDRAGLTFAKPIPSHLLLEQILRPATPPVAFAQAAAA